MKNATQDTFAVNMEQQTTTDAKCHQSENKWHSAEEYGKYLGVKNSKVKIFPFLLICLVFILSSCKTVYVPVEKERVVNNYEYKTENVYHQDSIYITEKEKGDTIYITEFRYKYIDKVRTDTIHMTDSIYTEKIITKTVELKPKKKAVAMLLSLFGIAVAALLFLFKIK